MESESISMGKHLIEKISMSTRLKNILRRSGIEYLEQIQEYPKESIQKFRNMGKETLQELYLLCEQYGIRIYDKSDLEDEEKRISFSPSKYEKLFIKGIRSKEELLKIDIHGLKKQYGLSNNDLEKLRKLKEVVEQRKGISL